jgi:hypothetical protein
MKFAKLVPAIAGCSLFAIAIALNGRAIAAGVTDRLWSVAVLLEAVLVADPLQNAS